MDRENMCHIINDGPVLSLAYTSMMHKAPKAFTDAPGWIPPPCRGSLSHLRLVADVGAMLLRSDKTAFVQHLNPWTYKCITLLVEVYLEIKPNSSGFLPASAICPRKCEETRLQVIPFGKLRAVNRQ